ncbi:MAG: hypothetical protein ACREFW_04255 [Rhizomicrobium sp.]
MGSFAERSYTGDFSRRIDVHVSDTREASGDIDEPAGPPSPVNPVAAATGIGRRRLPINRDILAGRKIA